MGLHWGGVPDALYWDGDVTEVYLGDTLVWRSIVTVTGEWFGDLPDDDQWQTIHTHVVDTDGPHEIEFTASGFATLPVVGGVGGMRFRLNGGERSSSGGNGVITRTLTETWDCAAGDTIEFQVRSSSLASPGVTATWSITKH